MSWNLVFEVSDDADMHDTTKENKTNKMHHNELKK